LLLVSWLLVAFIPGLLMLATFGLERLEAGLENDTVTASDVAEFLEQAGPRDVGTLVREGMPEALDCLHRRIRRLTDDSGYLPSRGEHATEPLYATAIIAAPKQPALTRPRHKHSATNRQFGPPRHANRV
jgi:hypothetical protein